MSWFSGKPLRTVVRVLAVSADSSAMDCADDNRVHVWLEAPSWSSRRAFLTGGDDFFRAFFCSRPGMSGLSADSIENMLSDDPIGMKMLPGWAAMLSGSVFYVDMLGPADRAEPGERIEISNIRVAPSLEEVECRLFGRPS